MLNSYSYSPYASGKSIVFSHKSDMTNPGIVFYDTVSGEEVEKIPFPNKLKKGKVYTLEVDKSYINYAYQFYGDEGLEPDLCAKSFDRIYLYGESRKKNEYRAVVADNSFRWGVKKDRNSDLMYQCHVRGFTAHPSSKVRDKGTFAGLTEKIAYLKNLGVGMLEIQPAYEFNENYKDYELTSDLLNLLSKDSNKKNYWGYSDGFYFVPKMGYCASDNPVKEFKTLVNRLHTSGIELIMQFWFSPEKSSAEICDILCYWSEIYHVDGFRIIGRQDIREIADNPYLCDVKIFSSSFDGCKEKENRFVYNDIFLQNIRHFIKSDECSLFGALDSIMGNELNTSRVNTVSDYNHFTLYDSVSYNHKNNYANGEDNNDGRIGNISWNCGIEGETTKKNVKSLRISQIKNALSFLILSPGIPMIMMGDEGARTLCGNNNAYCIDGELNYLDWKRLKKHENIALFIKELLDIRGTNKVFAQNITVESINKLKYPPVSFHSENAWDSHMNPMALHSGVMFADESSNSFIYMAVNMHWEKQDLCLPNIAKSVKWKLIIHTINVFGKEFSDYIIQLPPRSIMIFKGEFQNE